MRELVAAGYRLLVAEGVFNGIPAGAVIGRMTSVLDSGTEDERDAVVAVVRAVLAGTKAKYRAARKQIASSGLGPLIDMWPDAFLDALHLLGDTPFTSFSDADVKATQAGVDARLALDWIKLLKSYYALGYKPAGRTGTDMDSDRLQLDLVVRSIESIDGVLSRLPPALSSKYRKLPVAFYSPDPLLRLAMTDALVDKRAAKVGLRVRFEPQPKADAPGYHYAGGVAFRLPVRPHVIAHEYGHAVWEDVFDRWRAISYFQEVLDRYTSVESADAFVASVGDVLGRLFADDQFGTLLEVLSRWSIDYVRRASTEPVVQGLQDTLDKAIAEKRAWVTEEVTTRAWKVLGSWNELWAEAFARVILGRETPALRVPFAMIGLVEDLLARTRLPRLPR